jgi:hypothetical protein
MKVGDKVRYTPVVITEDKQTEGVIKQLVPAGDIFNQPMLVIEGVEHWIPAYECVEVETAK